MKIYIGSQLLTDLLKALESFVHPCAPNVIPIQTVVNVAIELYNMHESSVRSEST